MLERLVDDERALVMLDRLIELAQARVAQAELAEQLRLPLSLVEQLLERERALVQRDGGADVA